MDLSQLSHLEVPLGGRVYRILATKPTEIPNRRLCLLKDNDKKAGEEGLRSLWLAEIGDDGESFNFWPYEGPDNEKLELMLELSKYFVEHAFDDK